VALFFVRCKIQIDLISVAYQSICSAERNFRSGLALKLMQRALKPIQLSRLGISEKTGCQSKSETFNP
jgi:hypothetical protein